MGQTNRELAAGYLSDLSDLMLPVINQSSGDPSIDEYRTSTMRMITVWVARMLLYTYLLATSFGHHAITMPRE